MTVGTTAATAPNKKPAGLEGGGLVDTARLRAAYGKAQASTIVISGSKLTIRR